MILTNIRNESVDITPLLDYERGACRDPHAIRLDTGVSLNIDNPFDANILSFVLHGQPLSIWKQRYDKEYLVHPGDLYASNLRLEKANFDISGLGYSRIFVGDDVVPREGGYVYVIDGESGKYLCSLDYLYCFNRGTNVAGRNPFSVSNVTGLRPASNAISNGLYWQNVVNSNIHVKGDLYTSDVVGSSFKSRQKSLYWSSESYADDYEACTFGVAIAYVIDENLDSLDGGTRCIREQHYTR